MDRNGRSRRRHARRLRALESSILAVASQLSELALVAGQARTASQSAQQQAGAAQTSADAVRKQWGFVNAHLGSIERRMVGLTGKVYRPADGEVTDVMPEIAAFADAEALPLLDNEARG